MMNTFYEYILGIAAMAVLCVLLEAMVPEGGLKRTVQFCVGIIFVCCLAAPIVAGVNLQAAEKAFSFSLHIEQPSQIGPTTHEELLRGYYGDALE